MMCSLVSSDTGAGKKRAAMHVMQLDARQLADALACLKQLARSLTPGIVDCDTEQRELVLKFAPYIGVLRLHSNTHNRIAESVAFVVWEEHALTRLVALRRRSSVVRDKVAAVRALMEQLRVHLHMDTVAQVIGVLLMPEPTTVDRGMALDLLDMGSSTVQTEESAPGRVLTVDERD